MLIALNKKSLQNILYIFGLFGVDMLSKWFFFDQKSFSSLQFFQLVKNYGISFGINLPLPLIIFFSIIIGAILIFGYKKNFIPRVAFIFIIGGLLGNLFDRINLGFVRDFISIGNFPVFNFADICITFGAILIFLKNLKD